MAPTSSSHSDLPSPAHTSLPFAVFPLCFVFFVLFLYIYMIWQRDRLSRRRLIILSAACGGLDSAVLLSLPVVAFSPGDGEKKEKVMECAICLGEYVEGERVRLLPACNHGFHVECIDAWLAAHATCPFCRAAVPLAANPPLPATPPV